MKKSILLLCWLVTGCHKNTTVEGQWVASQEEQQAWNIDPPVPLPSPSYPWDVRAIAPFPVITKEFFRCHGSRVHPMRKQYRGDKEPIYVKDCGGSTSHSLPIRDGKEFIYPCLIEILNELQVTLQKSVVITAGHRCPTHEVYVHSTGSNPHSKYILGGAVDFYVEGYEYSPLMVIEALQHYYQKKCTLFSPLSPYSTEPRSWYNQEVMVTLYENREGRDFDNQHPFPYISIEVLYDREQQHPLVTTLQSTILYY